MNNSNYEYPPSTGGSTYNSPYSSTPSEGGARRPRFGYSGPSSYPRPRSSATKPNPDYNNYYGDSMSKNYGSTYDSYNSQLDSTHNSSSNYYSANESFYSNSLPPESSKDLYYPSTDKPMGRMEPGYSSNFVAPRANQYPLAPPFPSAPLPQFGQNQLTYAGVPTFATNAAPGPGIRFKGFPNNRKFPGKKKRQPKNPMAAQGIMLKCNLCNLDFTSQIPYDMHLRGARHAKKVKASQVSPAIQAQAGVGIGGEQTFYCAVCDVKANSPLQYQMHLEGTKHKNKLNPPDPNQATPAEPAVGKKKNMAAPTAVLNSKTNGSVAVTRPLPADFDQPPKAKMMKFSCDICNLTVNSDTQLQQHLVSKKHQYKVEGKPLPKKIRKPKTDEADADTVMTEVNPDTSAAAATAAGTSKGEVIMGVKTLSSSFVKSGTIV